MLMIGPKGEKKESNDVLETTYTHSAATGNFPDRKKKNSENAHISGHTSFSQVCKKCEEYTVAALVTRQVSWEGRIFSC